MRDREINSEHPDGDEHHDSRKFYALGDRADDQSRSNDRKHELIHREDVMRNPVGIITVRLGRYSTQEREFDSAQKWRATREDERISDRPPQNRNQPGDAEPLRS